MTGRINGAPIRLMKRPLPINLRRATARASGMAMTRLKIAERPACRSVKWIAAQSAARNLNPSSAVTAIATSGARVAVRTSAKAPVPTQTKVPSGLVRFAICQSLHCEALQPHPLGSAELFQGQSRCQTHRVGPKRAKRQDTSSLL